MKKTTRILALGLSSALLLLVDVSPQAPLQWRLVPEAHAIVGMPFTPMSYAGVARRTTRRYVAVEATAVTAASASAAAAEVAASQPVPPPPASPPIGSMVAALPAGCVSAPIAGVQYFKCGGVYYRPAFQGNNLVYVVQQP